MYIYYNPNPHGKSVGDCVIRAISKVTNQSWEKTFLELSIEAFLQYDMPSSNAVWGAYLKHLGFRKYQIPDICPDCYSIAEFAKDNWDGTFAVGTGTHVVAVINGDYYDSWDSGNEVPVFYWRKD